jgi:hypothetical protein
VPRFRQSSPTSDEYYNEQHRFEHWYRDNSVYFITARCRNRFPAFQSEAAKSIFWNRFDHYVAKYNFVPWVTSLIDNHYHALGYLRIGSDLGPMMQPIHGSVAKLVNDLLPERLLPFWVDAGKQGYFDGCIRNEKQCRRAYKYVLTQSVRHGIVKDWRLYPHTHVNIELERGLRRALQLNAFLPMIPYKRYGECDTRDRGEPS